MKIHPLLIVFYLFLGGGIPLPGNEIDILKHLRQSAGLEWKQDRLDKEAGALHFHDGTVKTALPAASEDGMLLEFWLKVDKWAPGGGPILRLTGPGMDLAIEKPAEEPLIRLISSGKSFGVYPVDHWATPLDWLKKEDARRWHHVGLAFSGGDITVFVDGFRVGAASTGTVKETPLEVTLSAPGALSFGEAFWHPYKLKDAPSFRMRYLQLYRNVPAVDQQTVTVPILSETPDAATFLDTGVLPGATTIPIFLALKKEQEAPPALLKERASVSMGRLGDHLYLAFRTPYEGTVPGRKIDKHDFSFGTHETYEVFIEPPWTGLTEYMQLVGSAHGDRADLQLMNMAWNGVWEWQTRILDGEWRGFMTVDLKRSGVPIPRHGDIWGLNFFNHHANLSWSWSRRFHDTGAFGRMLFFDDAPQLIPGYPEISNGKLRIALQAKGRDDQFPLNVRLEKFLPGKSLSAAQEEMAITGPGGEAILEVPCQEGDKGLYAICVRNRDEKVLYYQSFSLPDVSSARRGTVAEVKQETKGGTELPEWSAEVLGKTLQESRQWYNNTVGKREGVPHYLESLKLTDGMATVWNRTYDFNGALLVGQVTSNGRELLKGPSSLELKTGNGTFSIDRAETTITARTEREATIEAKTVADGVRIEVQNTLGFDGLAWFQVTLSPVDKPVSIDSLHLHLPMAREQAQLYNITSSESGHPPASDSGKIADTPMAYDFLREIVWIGTPREGLTWLAEDLRNWPLQNRDGLHIIEPGSDRVTFKVKLADPFVLREPVTYRFGIEATPLRPRDKDFRRKADRSILRWSWFWGEGDYYPFHDNPEMARSIIEKERKQGREVMPASSIYYFGKYRFGIPPAPFAERPFGGMIHPENLLFSHFWNAIEAPSTGTPVEILPSSQVADGDQWKSVRNQPVSQFRYNPASSFQDFYLWRLDREVRETGLGALYLDQTMMKVRNPLSDAGYIDTEGNAVHSVPLLGMRSMLERIQNVFEAAHGKSFIRWHSSNQMVIPVFPYIDVFWDGENYGHSRSKVYEFYSKLLTPEKLQVQHSGLPFGFSASLLPRLENRYAPTPASSRDMLGLFLIHDSHVWDMGNHLDLLRSVTKRWLDFPYQEAETFYYWDQGRPLVVSDPVVYPILHLTKTRGRIILFNWKDEPTPTDVTLSEEVKLETARDAESGTPINHTAEGFSVLLPPRDFRMIDFERK